MTITYPAPVTVLTARQFLLRLTPAERSGLRQLAVSNHNVGDGLRMIELGGELSLTDPELIRFLNWLVAQGHITAARATELLAP